MSLAESEARRRAAPAGVFRLALLAMVGAALAGCGCSFGCGGDRLAPFDTTPMAPPKGVTENFTRIGVCYNRQTTTPDQVVQVARDNCAPGTAPSLIEQDIELTCPLLTPVRATFACLAPGVSPPAR